MMTNFVCVNQLPQYQIGKDTVEILKLDLCQKFYLSTGHFELSGVVTK